MSSDGFGFKKSKLVSKSNPVQHEQNKSWALQLHNTLRTHRRVTSYPIRSGSWETEFSKLKKQYELSDQTIQDLLDWYCANLKNDYVPLIRSAKGFRQRLPEIQEAKLRISGSDSKTSKSEVQLSGEAAKVYNDLKTLYWPRGSVAQLPEVVEASLSNYREFVAELSSRMESIRAKERQFTEDLLGEENTMEGLPKEKRNLIFRLRRLVRFYEYLNSRCLSAPRHFVEGWFRAINSRLIKWEGWFGDLKPMIFRPNSDWFHIEGREWAVQYGDVALWHDLWMESGLGEKYK